MVTILAAIGSIALLVIIIVLIGYVVPLLRISKSFLEIAYKWMKKQL